MLKSRPDPDGPSKNSVHEYGQVRANLLFFPLWKTIGHFQGYLLYQELCVDGEYACNLLIVSMSISISLYRNRDVRMGSTP